MTEKEKKEAKKLRTFEVVAFGCHDRAYSRLAAFIRGAFPKIDTFMFVEYFSVCPTVYSAGNDPGGDALKVFFPFIRRIVDENQFLWIPQTDEWMVPDKDSNKDVKDPDDKNVKDDYRLEPKPRAPRNAPFTRPEHFSTEAASWSEGKELLSLWHGGTDPTADVNVNEFVRPFGSDEQNAYFGSVHAEPRLKNDPYRREYALLVHSWRMSGQNTTLIRYPLATKAVFYGYLIVLLPGTITEKDKKRAFMKALGDISQTLYVPVLALLRESFLEKGLVDAIEKEEAGTTWMDRANEWFANNDDDIPFRPCNKKAVKSEETEKRAKRKPILHKCCPAVDRSYHLDFELPLHRCWLWRNRYLGNTVWRERRRSTGVLETASTG